MFTFSFDLNYTFNRMVDTLPEANFFLLFELIAIYWAYFLYSIITKRDKMNYFLATFAGTAVAILGLWLFLGIFNTGEGKTLRTIRMTVASFSEIIISFIFIFFILICIRIYLKTENAVDSASLSRSRIRMLRISAPLILILIFFLLRAVFYVLLLIIIKENNEPESNNHYYNANRNLVAKVSGIIFLEYLPTLLVLFVYRPQHLPTIDTSHMEEIPELTEQESFLKGHSVN
eukprot:TRINITY_DN4633_c0_g1_i1.p1 TRINITY_DN4633_c0_g1~~TRINITY_DN4633_c0_g1_i1.p1  ORF type:complete len:232 (+),score=18.59 TRINITY_DN4633_c0_g1_i1:315-1010(+)